MAVWSGHRAAEVGKHTVDIHQVMGLHRKLGITTLILGAVVLACWLVAGDRLPSWARVLVLALMLAMAGTLAYGAHHGNGLDLSLTPRSRYTTPHEHGYRS